MAKKTLEVATLLCCAIIEELHPKLIMLSSYSLLSLLIKHAMILNILRRYQLSPPPGLVKSRANFSLLLTPADGASPVLELREVEAFCGTLGRREEGEGTQSRDTIRLLRGNTTNTSDGTFRVNNDKYPRS